jgi:DsbC/DsbD-like thiol-disulfide interchange protein
MKWLGTYVAVALMTVGVGTVARTQSDAGQAAEESHAKVELIADSGAGAAATRWVGVLFRLDPGWHVYWENPGDSGTPPKIEWHLPAGDKAGAIRWPTPKRLGTGSVIDYGYENQVLLMVPITGAAGSADVSSKSAAISADVRYVVCSEICIPGKAHVTLPGSESPQAHRLFEQTREEVPRPAPANWRISATQDNSHIVLRIALRTRSSLSFFPLDAGVIDNSAPQQLSVEDDGIHLTLAKSDQLVKPITRLRGLLVFSTGAALEITAPVAQ